VRRSTLVQTLVFLVVAGALAYAVIKVSKNWADWVVFGVIVCAALGGAIAVFKPEFPRPTKKRRFTRDSDSRW
jgi:hypothetical protein